MKSEELKSIQAPLKENYRSNPKDAFIKLSAEGKLGEGVTCNIKTGRALIDAGLHPATGGTGFNICSGDMLLEALVACAGVTMNAVATSLGIEIKEGIVKAEGDLDFRGTLGVSKEVAVGFQNIRLKFILNTNTTEEMLNTLIKLTERYCVVYQSIKNPPQFEITREVK
jgi:uncharacterized OsmC-like protein